MTPQQFIAKWQRVTLSERSAGPASENSGAEVQDHYQDLQTAKPA